MVVIGSRQTFNQFWMGGCQKTISNELNTSKLGRPSCSPDRVPLRLSPYSSDQVLIPARSPLLDVFPSLSHTFMSYSLYSKKNKHLKKTSTLMLSVLHQLSDTAQIPK